MHFAENILLRDLYSPLHRMTFISLICICISVKTKELLINKFLFCFSYLNWSPSCLKFILLQLLFLVLKITLKRILEKNRIISLQANYTWAFIYVCTVVKTPWSITQFLFQLSSLLYFSLLLMWKASFASLRLLFSLIAKPPVRKLLKRTSGGGNSSITLISCTPQSTESGNQGPKMA